MCDEVNTGVCMMYDEVGTGVCFVMRSIHVHGV